MATLNSTVSLNPFAATRRLVIKIGSAIIVDPETGALRTEWLKSLAADIANLRSQGVEENKLALRRGNHY